MRVTTIVNPDTGDVRLLLDGNLVVELRGGNPAGLLRELGEGIKRSARDVERVRLKLGYSNKG